MTEFTTENIETFIEWTEDMAKRAAPMKGLTEPYVVMNAMFKELLAYRTGKKVYVSEYTLRHVTSGGSGMFQIDSKPHGECVHELIVTNR